MVSGEKLSKPTRLQGITGNKKMKLSYYYICIMYVSCAYIIGKFGIRNVNVRN